MKKEYRNLDKEQIKRQIQAVLNEINLGWSDEKTKSLINEDCFDSTYAHYLFPEDAKIVTRITMTKVKVQNE